MKASKKIKKRLLARQQAFDEITNTCEKGKASPSGFHMTRPGSMKKKK